MEGRGGEGAEGWEGKFRGSGGRRERGRERGGEGKFRGGSPPPNIFS